MEMMQSFLELKRNKKKKTNVYIVGWSYSNLSSLLSFKQAGSFVRCPLGGKGGIWTYVMLTMFFSHLLTLKKKQPKTLKSFRVHKKKNKLFIQFGKCS